VIVEIENRRAARLLVLDGAGRILLFRHRDPLGRSFWATPGGGLEPGETFEAAARRESQEELGAVPASLRFAFDRDVTFPWGNRIIQQVEQYFLASYERTPAATARPAHAEEGLLEIRWWMPADLDSDQVRPPDLAARLRALEETR
jgi:8-oxo-dGTP pyrophosphatase MutT (NUDIX family)